MATGLTICGPKSRTLFAKAGRSWTGLVLQSGLTALLILFVIASHGLEGAESFDSGLFSSENVALQFKEPQDGKLKFTATPAVNSAKAFFMKVKVR